MRRVGARCRLTDHVGERDVEEHAGHAAEEPGGGVRQAAQQHAPHHAQEAQRRGQHVVQQRLARRHPRTQQHGEVAWDTHSTARGRG